MRFLIRAIIIVFSIFTFIGCADQQFESQSIIETKEDIKLTPEVLYGADNRQDWFEVVNDNHLKLAKSTMAVVDAAAFYKKNDKYYMRGEDRKFCPVQKFANQLGVSHCSAFLVAPEIAVTAGHCFLNTSDCDRAVFVFDYALKREGANPYQVDLENLYSCKRIIKRAFTLHGTDFAVIELNKKVVNREPLKVRTNGQVSPGTPLVLIGHPSGLPSKVEADGLVRSVRRDFFLARLDSFGGNSGSAVFNANTGEVEGILVRGEGDYTIERYRGGFCQLASRCPKNGCGGESVTKISEALPYFKEYIVDQEQETSDEVKPLIFLQENLNLKIPDNSIEGVTHKINIKEAPAGKEVMVYVDIKHTYSGDLTLELESPSGVIKILSNKKGGGMDDINAIYGRTKASQESLAPLSREKPGTWSLKVKDGAERDTGVLNSWAVIFTDQ